MMILMEVRDVYMCVYVCVCVCVCVCVLFERDASLYDDVDGGS